MSALSIEPTYPTFTDSDGSPLDEGYVWIGVAGSATPIANPQTAYWDAALTQVVTQPVRTRGGYPLNAGAIGRLYVAGDYSILVRNRNGYDLYSAPNATERVSGVVATIDSSNVTFLQAGTGAVTRTAQSKMRDVVSVFDFMTAAQIADVQAGTALVNVTAAIETALDSEHQMILFPAGTYLCDPIELGATQNNKTLIGYASSNNAYSAGQKQTRFLVSQANAVFWQLSSVFRLTVENIIFDGNGVSDIVYQLQQSCSRHTYKNCYFLNATPATGRNLFLGDDSINIQVDLNTFFNSKAQQAGFADSLYSVALRQTNTINNEFHNCGFANSEYNVYVNGASQCVFNRIDHQTYTQYAYLVSGAGILHISDCYTESQTGSGFYREVSVAYSANRQPCVIERNKMQGAANSISLLPTQRHIVRDNIINGAFSITMAAPANPAEAYSAVIENNTLGAGSSIVDSSGIAIQRNNYIGGAQQNDQQELKTWTPVLQPATGAFTSVTYNANTGGTYQRIGNVVHVTAYIETDAITVGTASGNVNIGGFPFAANAGQLGSLLIGEASGWSGDVPESLRLNGGTTSARLLYRTTANGASARTQVSDLSTGSAGNVMYISGFYFAA